MDLHAYRELLDRQAGVISRRQLATGGASDVEIRRWCRRRALVPMHNGVYIDHTGPPGPSSLAWAAVLACWPAALTHESSVMGPGHHQGPVHVAVDESRRVKAPVGVRLHRLVGLDSRVRWNLAPPRVRLEDALLSMCAWTASREQALTLIADACRRRVTTADRLAEEIDRRPKLRRRRWLIDVLAEARAGVHSPLESRYRSRVEIPHGLPAASRQVRRRTADGVVYRDVEYEEYRLVVELDGRLGHESGRDRWNDQDRDLLAAAHGVMTVRLGWSHCDSTPCRTAARLVGVLRGRGWRGVPRTCGPGCELIGSYS